MSHAISVTRALCGAVLAVLVAGCTSSPAGNGDIAGRTAADGERFAMQPGERVTLSDNSTLRYVEVKSDSRCMPGLQCIHAGNAVLAFELRRTGGSVQSFELNSPDQPQSRDMGSLRVTLQSLAFGVTPRAQLKVERIN
ncbi:MAG: hypothetical protein M3Q51_01650 [Pseudomonadota bacterium]|nr:hypothetical protein [Pseudomonadota bacterium]